MLSGPYFANTNGPGGVWKGNNRRIMKLKVILSCAVFALMLVVLVIEIAELFPGPPLNCTTAQLIPEPGHLAYNPCATLYPEQVVFVRN